MSDDFDNSEQIQTKTVPCASFSATSPSLSFQIDVTFVNKENHRTIPLTLLRDGTTYFSKVTVFFYLLNNIFIGTKNRTFIKET